MPDVKMTLNAGTEIKNSVFSPQVGGVLEIGFDPGSANVKVDYSKPDSLVVTVEGEFKLKDVSAVPLTLGAGASIATSGEKTVKGSVSWEISKEISATAEVNHSTVSGTSAMAGLTIKF